MKMILLMAWRNIWRNKRRSIITISSIFCAVFFAVFARSFQIGVYNKMIENMVGMYTGYLQIHQDGFWEEQSIDNSFVLDAELLDLITRSENIGNFNERLESFALTASGNLTKGAIVMGVDLNKEDQLMKLNSKMTAGEFPTDSSDAILLSEGLAQYYNLTVGDSLILLGQGYHGASANGIFPIQGIVKLPVPNLNDRMIFMPILAAQKLYDATDRLTSLVLQIDKPSGLNKTKNSLLKKMNLEKYELLDWKSLLPELVQTIQADSAGGIIILGILYMIITLGILGTLLMMTAERMYEFGILVSIGMRKTKLILTLLIESIMMGLLGIILGVIGVSPVRYYFYLNPIRLQAKAAESVEAFGFEPVIPASLDMDIALNHSCLVLLIVLLCSIYPSITILRLQPIKAMKS
ncbi:MAG: transporter [Flavobacteriales bacterium]|nr:transporter [Flavobacteriales bacterium]|tara:strand:- start:5131 stop:6354 length:1224 start_codon:yes stop_codon:yes gene_type:complete